MRVVKLSVGVQNFEEGMGYLKMLKKVPAPGTPQGYAIMGHTDVRLLRDCWRYSHSECRVSSVCRMPSCATSAFSISRTQSKSVVVLYHTGLIVSSFLQMYNDQVWLAVLLPYAVLTVVQVMFEVMKWNAWTEGEPDEIIDQAQERLRAQGWDAVRPALAVTVRSARPSTLAQPTLTEMHNSQLLHPPRSHQRRDR